MELLDHIFQRVFPFAGCICLVKRPSRLNDTVEVDAGPVVEGPPQTTRHVEEESLEEQNYGHPLVIWNHMSLLVFMRFGDVVLEGKIVGIFDPAVLVCVIFPWSGEVSRNPAVDVVADILVEADDEGEHDEQHTSVAMVQTVHQIVIIPLARLGCPHMRDDIQDFIHLGRLGWKLPF